MVDTGLKQRQLYYLRALFVKQIARHKFTFSLIVTTGVVLVWRGIWGAADVTPIISSSIGSIVVGIILIWLIKKYSSLS